MTTSAISADFLDNCRYRLEENLTKVGRCLEHLDEEAIWARTNSVSNSVGNLILHLCGNMRQYGIASLGNNEDIRDRDKEFTDNPQLSAEELLHRLKTIVEAVIEIIEGVSETELLRVRDVQAYRLSGIGVLLHLVEHFSYHTGQIVYFTKERNGIDLQLYKGVDLNSKNKE